MASLRVTRCREQYLPRFARSRSRQAQAPRMRDAELGVKGGRLSLGPSAYLASLLHLPSNRQRRPNTTLQIVEAGDKAAGMVVARARQRDGDFTLDPSGSMG